MRWIDWTRNASSCLYLPSLDSRVQVISYPTNVLILIHRGMISTIYWNDVISREKCRHSLTYHLATIPLSLLIIMVASPFSIACVLTWSLFGCIHSGIIKEISQDRSLIICRIS